MRPVSSSRDLIVRMIIRGMDAMLQSLAKIGVMRWRVRDIDDMRGLVKRCSTAWRDMRVMMDRVGVTNVVRADVPLMTRRASSHLE
jgi:hypothetical protein